MFRLAHLNGSTDFRDLVIVVEVAPRRPLPVVIVPLLNRPNRQRRKDSGQQEGQGERKREETHDFGLQRSRRVAFPTTTNEDALMAIAACSGSRIPTMASGTATTL